MNAPASFPSSEALSQEVRDTLRGWRKVSGPICNGSPCGPDWVVCLVPSNKHYRIGDFTYQRMLKGAEPTPYGWMEIDPDAEEIE